METQVEALPVPAERPNFSLFHWEGFCLDVESNQVEKEKLQFPPLKFLSPSDLALPRWELRCRAASRVLAGGCTLALPDSLENFPAPGKIPHPVLGEWIRALCYTRLKWLELGPITVATGFLEVNVITAIWEAMSPLMKRNDIRFLVGKAPENSLALNMALQRGSLLLESGAQSPWRYFLFVE